MADQSSFETVLATVAHDPVFRDFAQADSALLMWDLEGARLLWTSPSAAGLREALVDDAEGRVRASFPARTQLRALGQGLAPASGARLERLRFDPSRLTAPVTCACRRVTLPSGEGVLLTAIVGAVPMLSRGVPKSSLPAKALARVEPIGSGPTGHAASHRETVDLAAQLQGLGTVRFLWRTDAEGRFTSRSDTLAEVVGHAGAAIIGRTWGEIAGELVFDPAGSVSGLLAGDKTWSARTVLWRVTGMDCAIPVDLAGTPVFGPGGRFLGFRGFGLCRTENLSAWSPEARSDEAAAEAPPPAAVDGQVARESGASPDVVAPIADPTPAAPAATEQSEPAAEIAALAPDLRPPEHRSFPHLSAEERTAFREIARALGARFEDRETPDPGRPLAEIVPVRAREPAHPQSLEIVDNLPVGVIVYRGETLLFANRLLLDLIGYEDVPTLTRDGGLARLFPGLLPSLPNSEGGAAVTLLSTLRRESLAVEVRLARLSWEGLPATVMVVRTVPDTDPTQRLRAQELDLRAGEARLRELTSVLDTATDGVVLLDDGGRILSLNRSAEALFGYDQREVAGDSVTVLLATESHGLALDYLDRLQGSGVAGLLNDGREVVGRVRQGGTIPLFMTAGRTSDSPERKFCIVLRDITALKKAEAELLAAKRVAEEAGAEKSDFLAKVSHELRTPLSAIIGFAEVMLEERFGAIGNERYRDYLKDIHDAGRRVMSLMTDLLDLAKIESGRRELSFAGVDLNDLVASCVGTFLHNATRERIVIRTSFAPKLPPVVADQSSVQQIVANVVSNAVKFTPAGGQVIVSTALTDRGEVAVRVRDTGIGMTDEEIEAALQPFRQLATARKGGGTGLGLPLTKALVEANRGRLHITSAPSEGTLVEIVFPPTRVLVE